MDTMVYLLTFVDGNTRTVSVKAFSKWKASQHSIGNITHLELFKAFTKRDDVVKWEMIDEGR